MTTTDKAAGPDAEAEGLRAKLAALEAKNAEQTDTIATLNGIVQDYQQMHADAVFQATTLKNQFAVAARRGSPAGAQ